MSILLSDLDLKYSWSWQHAGAPSSISHIPASQPECSPQEAGLILLSASCYPWDVTWVPQPKGPLHLDFSASSCLASPPAHLLLLVTPGWSLLVQQHSSARVHTYAHTHTHACTHIPVRPHLGLGLPKLLHSTPPWWGPHSEPPLHPPTDPPAGTLLCILVKVCWGRSSLGWAVVCVPCTQW